jgi:hypothetical protein
MTAIGRFLIAFADASKLRTNLSKSEIFPMRCLEEKIVAALECIPARWGSFPCTYLGLPLHHSPHKAVHFQPLLDKVGARLTAWWYMHFTRKGRVPLCRLMLSSIIIYHLAVFRLPKWIIRKL